MSSGTHCNSHFEFLFAAWHHKNYTPTQMSCEYAVELHGMRNGCDRRPAANKFNFEPSYNSIRQARIFFPFSFYIYIFSHAPHLFHFLLLSRPFIVLIQNLQHRKNADAKFNEKKNTCRCRIIYN